MSHLSRLRVKLVKGGQDENSRLTHTGLRLAHDVHSQDSLKKQEIFMPEHTQPTKNRRKSEKNGETKRGDEKYVTSARTLHTLPKQKMRKTCNKCVLAKQQRNDSHKKRYTETPEPNAENWTKQVT